MTRGRPRTTETDRVRGLSPLLVPLAEARATIERIRFVPWPVETVPLARAVGRLAARPVRARRDVPRVPLAAMDGYAVGPPSRGRPGSYRLRRGAIRPGSGRGLRLGPGQAVECATGARLPFGAEAVVRLERGRRDGDRLLVRRTPVVGQDVHVVGEDVRAGTELLQRGEEVRPYHLATLLGQGLASLSVYAPRVALIAVGDELGRSAERRGPQVDDTITPALRPLLPTPYVRIERGAPDDRDRLARRLRRAARRSDLVITVGGTSVGPRDATKPAVRRVGRVLFDGVRVSVLKRAAVGTISGRPVVILPGQVGSAIVAWHEHGLHVIGRCVGREQRSFEEVRLRHSFASDRRMDSAYLLSVAGGTAIALPWGVRRASELLRANAFAIVPRRARLAKGRRLIAQRLVATAPVGTGT